MGFFYRRRLQGEAGKVVVKYKGVCIVWIAFTVGAQVAGAQVAFRVVRRPGSFVGFLLQTTPGPSGSVRRDLNPFVEQRIVSAMWVFFEVEWWDHAVMLRQWVVFREYRKISRMNYFQSVDARSYMSVDNYRALSGFSVIVNERRCFSGPAGE